MSNKRYHNELHKIGWEEDEIIRAKSPGLQQADVLGWFDGEKLASQVATYPLQVNIFNRTYAMGGLTGAGTFPEYSGQGLMKLLSWNQGTYTLRIDPKGKGEIFRSHKQSEDSISIQTMTTMLLGYKRPEYLHKIGRIKCAPETIELLENTIEQKTPYFSDFF
ncbi:sterol carrier protein domain-containing protein [Paenibacillus kribbensis]|uniref:sterol carrier protein domain-containing protein n=1 Tax=Paenibacillus kribbensis TaxID=172713 RepID=UPI001FC9AD7D|nr:GNAT family N-acetyltransferase [Paenibacillus kribbensis]